MIFGIKTQVIISAIGSEYLVSEQKQVESPYRNQLLNGLRKRNGTGYGYADVYCTSWHRSGSWNSITSAKSYSYSSPVLLAFVFMLIALSSFIIYTFMDKKLDASIAQSVNGKTVEEAFELKDILFIIKTGGSGILPYFVFCFIRPYFRFCFYATDLVINKYHVNPNLAGSIPALLPLGTIFLHLYLVLFMTKKGKAQQS